MKKTISVHVVFVGTLFLMSATLAYSSEVCAQNNGSTGVEQQAADAHGIVAAIQDSAPQPPIEAGQLASQAFTEVKLDNTSANVAKVEKKDNYWNITLNLTGDVDFSWAQNFSGPITPVATHQFYIPNKPGNGIEEVSAGLLGSIPEKGLRVDETHSEWINEKTITIPVAVPIYETPWMPERANYFEMLIDNTYVAVFMSSKLKAPVIHITQLKRHDGNIDPDVMKKKFDAALEAEMEKSRQYYFQNVQ